MSKILAFGLADSIIKALIATIGGEAAPNGMYDALRNLELSYKQLQHEYDTTRGLWTTDSPHLVYDPHCTMSQLVRPNEMKALYPPYEGQYPQLVERLRPVSFRVYMEPSGGKPGVWFSSEGTFIRWADSFVEFQVGPGNRLVALVEHTDGQVYEVLPKNLQFQDAADYKADLQQLGEIPGYVTKANPTNREIKKRAINPWKWGDVSQPERGQIVNGRIYHDTPLEEELKVYFDEVKICFVAANNIAHTFAIDSIEWQSLSEEIVPKEYAWCGGDDFPDSPRTIELILPIGDVFTGYYSKTTGTYHQDHGVDHFTPDKIRWRDVPEDERVLTQATNTALHTTGLDWTAGIYAPTVNVPIDLRIPGIAEPHRGWMCTDGRFLDITKGNPKKPPFYDAHEIEWRYTKRMEYMSEWISADQKPVSNFAEVVFRIKGDTAEFSAAMSPESGYIVQMIGDDPKVHNPADLEWRQV